MKTYRVAFWPAALLRWLSEVFCAFYPEQQFGVAATM